jgi:hypothetical protein
MAETDPGMEEKPAAQEAATHFGRVKALLTSALAELGSLNAAQLIERGFALEEEARVSRVLTNRDRIELLPSLQKRSPQAAEIWRYLIASSLAQDGEDAGEEKEAAEIYDRIDRELAVEEARADRLLRLYNL